MEIKFDIEVYNLNGLTVVAHVSYNLTDGLVITISVTYINNTIRKVEHKYNVNLSHELLDRIRMHYKTFAWFFDNDRESTFPYLHTVPPDDRNIVDDMDYCAYEWHKIFMKTHGIDVEQ